MPRVYPRSERVERLAREVLSVAIHELKDPRVGFATVIDVKMSPDLRKAKVFVSVLGSDEDRESTMEGIQHAASYLRSILGREVKMRYLPALEIVEDLTAIHSEKIESLLRRVGVSKPPEAELLDPGSSEEEEQNE